jgi:hypothetical protein
MAANKKCAHPGCNCAAREGSDYCGSYCESNDTPEVACSCGHPPCKTQ